MNILTVISKSSCIPYINSGGCARYALTLHRRLKKKGINSQIIYLSRSFQEGEYLRHKKRLLHSCSHAILRINGEFYDAEGMLNKKYIYSTYSYFCVVPERYVKDTINCKKKWNPMFEEWNSWNGQKVIDNYLNSIFKSL